ncbi:hypothetical protein [Tuwongella immobilis]|uniref:Uncharacterized protein n=1 Tax=Tuwongella immobilis TaxID=692036 RepID=A0A6C2YQZ9_9BACT|nr:hypothetical protein [Tuwongella immobilis]VIP03906.1 unnamed protein product [Tuwongella immobilis]VTS05179.1 unnamed protein product [Tuwongella immobilis]
MITTPISKFTRLAVWLGLFSFLSIVGCAAPRENLVVPPRPVETPITSIPEWITTNRQHLTQAIEAFYLDDWVGMDRELAAIQMSIPQLTQFEESDPTKKTLLTNAANQLTELLPTLRKAVTDKQVESANRSLSQVGLQLRQLSLVWLAKPVQDSPKSNE